MTMHPGVYGDSERKYAMRACGRYTPLYRTWVKRPKAEILSTSMIPHLVVIGSKKGPTPSPEVSPLPSYKTRHLTGAKVQKQILEKYDKYECIYDSSQPHTQEENKVNLIYLVINYVNVLSPKKRVETELRVW